jgi:thioredoxin reductase (NADPH)
MVRLLVREDDLAENMSRYLADRVERCDRIKVNLHCDVSALLGRDGLELVEVTDNRSGERRTLPARALFVFIGAAPHTSWLGSQLALDDHGYVLTGDDAARSQDEAARAASGQPLPLETTWPGVFAAGDVRSGSIKRVASAVGEGAMAVRMAHERRAR